MHYNYFRSYSAERGRYTQADPIGLEGGFNRFGYVEGNALGFSDPLGLHPVVQLVVRAYGVAQGALYRYAPTLTELVVGASGVNGAVTSPMSPLVAQIPTNISRATPTALAAAEAIQAGGFCSAKNIEQLIIQFGKVENQISHTFRHIEKAGFDRRTVQAAIEGDLLKIAGSLQNGQYTGSVVVNGVKLDYSAFKLLDGTVNVGRITPPR